MTDQEIICTWMADPRKPGYFGRWWSVESRNVGGEWHQDTIPRPLTLDALWEVEERLMDEQWHAYIERLIECIPAKFPRCGQAVHATPEQKIKALAAVLRPIVEGKAA